MVRDFTRMTIKQDQWVLMRLISALYIVRYFFQELLRVCRVDVNCMFHIFKFRV
jgi:hypothetical protein